MIDLIGAPFDLSGKWFGSRLGPDALRLAGLPEALRSLGYEVTDHGDLTRHPEATAEGGIRNFRPMTLQVQELRGAVELALQRGSVPIVLGGEHTVALGGISAALNTLGEVAVLWIDAHVDGNTPQTSPSGNLHGMPLAALWGLPSGVEGKADGEWLELGSLLGPKCLPKNRTGWIGLREVDAGEAAQVKSAAGSLVVPMDELDRRGPFECFERFHAWMVQNQAKHLWVSFDVDAIDPIFAPGTGTAVRGGLTYREAHLLAELIREHLEQPDCPYRLAGVDVVEANPIRDTTNMTSLVAVEWVASLFGKTILGKR